MPDHKIGTREEWEAARAEVARLEAEQAERDQEIKAKRLELPWVPVEKAYQSDTEHGKKSLEDLFDGRAQLLAYNIMFGPDFSSSSTATIATNPALRVPLLNAIQSALRSVNG
jgi:predicted dithiol-disulfide oxidoreductase (DUF899 family)